MWIQSRYALEFFQKYSIPFWNMSNANNIVSGQNLCLANSNTVVVFLINGGSASIVLPGTVKNIYDVRWYDPFLGGKLKTTSLTTLLGGAGRSLGRSPSNNDSKDWVVLLRCINCKN
jgi:hypothetical protein